jgi:hypothetical protein
MNGVTVFRSAFFGMTIGCLIGTGSALAQQPPSRAECPFNEALEYQVVQALKVNGVTDEQFEALAAAGEIGRTISGACIAELNYAAANPDTACQRANGVAISRLSSYVMVASYLFLVTGDARTFRTNLRAILANLLNSVPRQCWFQGFVMPVAPPNDVSPDVSSARLTPTQCAQLRANFEACKQQANTALRTCTVTPHARNCAYTAPACMLPPC